MTKPTALHPGPLPPGATHATLPSARPEDLRWLQLPAPKSNWYGAIVPAIDVPIPAGADPAEVLTALPDPERYRIDLWLAATVQGVPQVAVRSKAYGRIAVHGDGPFADLLPDEIARWAVRYREGKGIRGIVLPTTPEGARTYPNTPR